MTSTIDTLMELADKYASQWSSSYEYPTTTREDLRTALTEALKQVGFNGLTESETNETMSVMGLSATKAAHQSPMQFMPWSKEGEMIESWTHEQQLVKPIAQRVSDLVERLGGIEYLESRSSKPVQKPLTYEQIQQLYIKAYNGGDHGRDFETAFVKEIETAHGITGSRE